MNGPSEICLETSQVLFILTYSALHLVHQSVYDIVIAKSKHFDSCNEVRYKCMLYEGWTTFVKGFLFYFCLLDVKDLFESVI